VRSLPKPAEFSTPPARRGGAWRGATLVATIALLLAGAHAQITAPAYNWSLPVFSSEGYRTMIARGSQAQVTSAGQFDVLNLNLTMFSGDTAARVENVILSPAATFLPEAKVARGDQSVRFIGQGVEATGVHWVYHHAEKKISLNGTVRVTFNAELKDLLQ
jgi:hypothetical protein